MPIDWQSADQNPSGATGEATREAAPRNTWRAMWATARRRCPACETGPMFDGFLAVHDHCPSCGEALHHQQADDAPPYFTTFIVGHIVVGLVLSAEMAYEPPLWVHALVWLPMALVLSLIVLPITKGALIGIQWAQRMHGFGDGPDPAAWDRDALAMHGRGAGDKPESRPY